MAKAAGRSQATSLEGAVRGHRCARRHGENLRGVISVDGVGLELRVVELLEHRVDRLRLPARLAIVSVDELGDLRNRPGITSRSCFGYDIRSSILKGASGRAR
jgi:hypothetical protein